MNGLLLLLLPAVVLAASTGPDSRIVNGQAVEISFFPWQGSYRSASGSHSCGCVFVGGKYVISAAHCGGSTSNTMEFGTSNRGSGKVYGIAVVTNHPDYGVGDGFSPNDISIIFAGEDISGENIMAGVMASPTTGNPGGTGYITGWGRTCGSCSLPTELRGVQLPIIQDSECDQRWGSSFQSSTMICVYNGESGSCNGDSGGPLSVGNFIHGVTSWGATGCGVTYPSVYTRVGNFKAWVCEQTGNGPVGC